MKKVDEKEYFDCKQENIFHEYKYFRAEQYYSSEQIKLPPEARTYDESFHVQNSNKIREEKNDLFDLNKNYNQLNLNSSTTNLTSSSTISNVAANASVSTVGATTLAAAVVISVTTLGGLFATASKHIQINAGMDYAAITLNMDEIITGDDQLYGLSADNFMLEIALNQGIKQIDLQNGNHTYLITGLEPNQSYSYNLICKNSSLGNTSTYHSDTLSTPISSIPTGVYDERNNFVLYDDYTDTLSFTYSIYLSDYNHEYINPKLYVCRNEQFDFNHMNNVLYTTTNLNEDSFFTGTINGIVTNELYFYILANPVNQLDEIHSLFSYKPKIEFPDEWNHLDQAIFKIDQTQEDVSCLPNQINITGKLLEYDSSYPLYAYFKQYSQDGLAFEPCEVDLMIEEEDMTYFLCCDSYYQLDFFQYVIYTTNKNLERIPIYESDYFTFTANQEFDANYTKVLPKDALIEYDENSITILVDPQFSTPYTDVFFYKLDITNRAGVLYGQYQGTQAAEITIENVEGLDQINFIYYDCARFFGEEIEYASYTKDGQQFGLPKVSLYHDIEYNGEYFAIQYDCDMIYPYENTSMDLTILNDEEEYNFYIESLSTQGEIMLDTITKELGEVTVFGTFYFKDNQSDQTLRSIPIAPFTTTMNYSFTIENVNADLSLEDSVTIPITMKFSHHIPNTYHLLVVDSSNAINIDTPIAEDELYFRINDSGDAITNLTITILDEDLNPWGTSYQYMISKSEALAHYTEPTIFCTNPYDAVVTYNDDNTINLYRNMNFSCDNEDVYYNAFIYDDSSYDETLDRTIYYNSYDIIGREQYAVIENIPLQDYFFIYHTMFDYQNVSYTIYSETPSGGIVFSEEDAIATITASSNTTSININVPYGFMDNKIIYNGNEYQYTEYTEKYGKSIFTINQEIEVPTVTVFYTNYGTNYALYSAAIPLKGAMYRQIEITAQAEL